MVSLSFQGAALEPKTAGLIMAWMQAVEFYGIADLIPHVRERLFVRGQAIVREGHVWRLTDWGELTMRELVRLAIQGGTPAPLKREQMLGILELAGYDPPPEVR